MEPPKQPDSKIDLGALHAGLQSLDGKFGELEPLLRVFEQNVSLLQDAPKMVNGPLSSAAKVLEESSGYLKNILALYQTAAADAKAAKVNATTRLDSERDQRQAAKRQANEQKQQLDNLDQSYQSLEGWSQVAETRGRVYKRQLDDLDQRYQTLERSSEATATQSRLYKQQLDDLDQSYQSLEGWSQVAEAQGRVYKRQLDDLDQRYQTLKRSSEELASQAQNYRDQLHGLDQRYQTLARSSESANKELKNEQSAIAAASSDLGKARAEIVEMKRELEQKQQSLTSLQADLDIERTAKQDAQQDRQRIQERYDILRAGASKFQDSAKQAYEDAVTSQERAVELGQEIGNFRATGAFAQISADLAQAKAKADEAQTVAKNLTPVVRGLKNEVKQTSVDSDKLDRRVTLATVQLSQTLKDINGTIGIGTMADKGDSLRDRLHDLRKGQNSAEKSMQGLKQKLQSSEQKNEQLKRSLTLVDGQILDHEAQLRNSRSRAAELQREFKTSENNNASLKADIERLNLETLTNQATLKKSKNRSESLLDDIKVAKKTVQDLDNQIEHSTLNRGRLSERLTQSNDQADEIQKELDASVAKAGSLNGDLLQLGKDIDETQRKINESNGRADDLQREFDTSQERVENLGTSLLQLRKDIKEAEGKVQTATDRVTELDALIKERSQESDRKVSDFDKAIGRGNALDGELQTAKGRVVGLERDLHTSRERLERLGIDVDSAKTTEEQWITLKKALRGEWLKQHMVHVTGRSDFLLRVAKEFTDEHGHDPIAVIQELGSMLKDLRLLVADQDLETTEKGKILDRIKQLNAAMNDVSLYAGTRKPSTSGPAPAYDQRPVTPSPALPPVAVVPELSLSSDIEPQTTAAPRKRAATSLAEGERSAKSLRRRRNPSGDGGIPIAKSERVSSVAPDETRMSGALPVETDPVRADPGQVVVDLTADSDDDEHTGRSNNPRLDDEEDDQEGGNRSDLDLLMDLIVFGWDASDAEKAQVRKQFQPFVENSKKSLDEIIKALDMHAFGPPTKADGGPYPRGCVLAWLGHIPGSAAVGENITQKSCGFCKDRDSYICGWLKHLPGVATGYGARGVDGKVPKAFVRYDQTAGPRTVPFNGRQVRWVLKKRKETKHDAQETFIPFKGGLV